MRNMVSPREMACLGHINPKPRQEINTQLDWLRLDGTAPIGQWSGTG